MGNYTMISYLGENLTLAVKAMDSMPHMEVLSKYLPEILACDSSNELSQTGNFPFKAAVFNIERGAYLKQILAYFRYHTLLRDVDVIFANEVDCGMARTGNLDIPREIAGALGMNFAYAVEFLSLEAGRDGNGPGFHGNAIFSKFPLSRITAVRLPIKYEWFYCQDQRRLGTRCAVLAEIEPKPGCRMGLVCVHLENRTTPQGRKEQIQVLLDEAEAHFGKDIPVLIGGDLNTLCYDDGGGEGSCLADHPGEQLRRLGQVPFWEPLLDYAASRGFGYGDCNILEKPTCRGPLEDGRTMLLNLDWFLCRGAACSRPLRVESIFRHKSLVNAPGEVYAYYGQELADHDMVLVTCGA
jgi:endonuclease/exonuclease/phosphatase family metal-dependent hydrolase